MSVNVENIFHKIMSVPYKTIMDLNDVMDRYTLYSL